MGRHWLKHIGLARIYVTLILRKEAPNDLLMRPRRAVIDGAPRSAKAFVDPCWVKHRLALDPNDGRRGRPRLAKRSVGGTVA
eukprot:4874416-Lingulodinium_polyedra.AAC.1